MLDLNAGIHFDEKEIPAYGIVDELDGAGIDVVERLDQSDGRIRHAGARALIERRGGRFLDQLLMPTLHAAIALAEMDVVAVPVAEYLDLDVANLREEPLEIDFRVAERRLGLGRRLFEIRGEFLRLVDDPHAAAAAAATRLQ